MRFSVLRAAKNTLSLAAAMAGVLVLFGPVPSASAAPQTAQSSKCGSLDNGELCIYGPDGPITGNYTTEYCRTGGSGTINVQFGYQIDGGSYIWDGWDNQFIGTGNCGSYTRRLSNLGSDDSIRGIMMTDGNVYVTRWMYVS
ncbi:hypothetical protein ACFU3E_12255 [Streptomyces sp. NPDC057424]|uniref:hypothetical protein n=1 Tax=Streptomyces sp. NPDC057424 TaxID=3346127 RepID=UPI0036B5443F